MTCHDGYIYLAVQCIKFPEEVKLGYTRDVRQRLGNYNTATAADWGAVFWKVSGVEEWEREILWIVDEWRVKAHWGLKEVVAKWRDIDWLSVQAKLTQRLKAEEASVGRTILDKWVAENSVDGRTCSYSSARLVDGQFEATCWRSTPEIPRPQFKERWFPELEECGKRSAVRVAWARQLIAAGHTLGLIGTAVDTQFDDCYGCFWLERNRHKNRYHQALAARAQAIIPHSYASEHCDWYAMLKQWGNLPPISLYGQVT